MVLLDSGYPKEMAWKIECDTCGRTSLVMPRHGKYCPYCGRDVVANIKITPPKHQ